jgi:2,3-bisphosphoglycerate-independent phosphoglycerate mutase
MKTYRPVALIILDGWGIREMEEGNAVVQADTPNFDRWLRTRERAILDASGEAVGLPEGQMGNSEVGHLNLGAGRVVYQDITRIYKAIADESFYDSSTLVEAITQVKAKNSKLHLIGLLGTGGVHSHDRHLYALLDLAKRHEVEPIIHVITDGRDTPPRRAIDFVEKLESYLAENPGVIASVSGRYYAMDRDRRWQRTKEAYDVIANHQGYEGRTAPTASEAIARAYEEGVTDEFIRPVAIEVGDRNVKVEPGDCLIFYNFRADRMRQIVRAFVLPDFDGFEREFLHDLTIVTMTSYAGDLPVGAVFEDVDVTNPLAEVLSRRGCRQFHAAETEKYAHVTYFFNGGREEPFEGETRYLEQSPPVATYDLQPEMSAYPLTNAILDRIKNHDDDFILVNYANPDMVGHTGVLEAAVKAVEAVDECAGRLVEAIVVKGGVALVTADHGNCERMIDLETGHPHTYHTTQPVSFFIIGDEYFNPRPRGILADVAPTVLNLMDLEQPDEMTGLSLISRAIPPNL